MATIALISNPRSTGNLGLLPAIRDFCAANPNVYHYEIDNVSEVPEALKNISRIRPDIIAINGGDGTVQRALTELHQGGYFDHPVPPVAVLPNGRTNLIANDLGCGEDPVAALAWLVAMPQAEVESHVVPRQLIRLTGANGAVPVFGMFLGGAGLAEIILICRRHIYPLGLPNWASHALAALVLFGMVIAGRGLLQARRLRISVKRSDGIEGSFVALLVTTLDRLLLGVHSKDRKPGRTAGALKLLAIERRRSTVVKTAWGLLKGDLGERHFAGFHLGDGDEIRIEGNRPGVILDGEYYQAAKGASLLLRPTAPVQFLSFAQAA